MKPLCYATIQIGITARYSIYLLYWYKSMLAYKYAGVCCAGVCWRVLACTGVCWCMLVQKFKYWRSAQHHRLPWCGAVCWRMLAYAGVCWSNNKKTDVPPPHHRRPWNLCNWFPTFLDFDSFFCCCSFFFFAAQASLRPLQLSPTSPPSASTRCVTKSVCY